ncbi:MAG: phosphoserine phosphatase SerB [Pseudomonadota bacterium]
MPTTIIHAAQLRAESRELLERTLGALEHRGRYHRVRHDAPLDPVRRRQLSEAIGHDINTLPEGFDPRAVRLLVSDMDSTLINIECIDEIADFLNIKSQVSAITESAMRGEIDFETSLTRRVALLKGTRASALELVYHERLSLNPGAEELIHGLKRAGVKFALVSGGFTFFTERLKERLKLDYAQANVLGIDEGALTGVVVGKIVGAQAKADFLLRLCGELNITPKQVIAVGDGANDLVMMAQAGLSVAYHAKPKVQAQAATAINYGGLNLILDLLELS